MVVEKLDEFVASREAPKDPKDYHASNFLSDGEILPKILEMIKSAKVELLLVTPWFYHNDIKGLLIKKRLAGVICKVITRKYTSRDNSRHLKTIQELDQAGVQVAFSQTIHAKMVIKDDMELLLSSKNFIDSNTIDYGNWSMVQNDVRKAREEFFKLYNQRFHKLYYGDKSK